MTTSDAIDEADDSVRDPAFRVSKYLVISFLVWLIATVAFFAGEASGLIVPPIAVDAFMSLVGLYTPVFLVCVLLLLFLTRKRDSVDWERVFGANKATAMIEALLSLGYLLVTQLVLGGAFGIGLHYPGPAVYQTANPSFNAGGVWLWALLNAFVYVVLPMAWLVLAKNFSMRTLWSSLEWRRDLWIIVAYWAFDFFGPRSWLARTTIFWGSLPRSICSPSPPVWWSTLSGGQHSRGGIASCRHDERHLSASYSTAVPGAHACRRQQAHHHFSRRGLLRDLQPF